MFAHILGGHVEKHWHILTNENDFSAEISSVHPTDPGWERAQLIETSYADGFHPGCYTRFGSVGLFYSIGTQDHHRLSILCRHDG